MFLGPSLVGLSYVEVGGMEVLTHFICGRSHLPWWVTIEGVKPSLIELGPVPKPSLFGETYALDHYGVGW